ncbi:MAG: hypothetical protein JSU86_09540 [Phycisphaerales bacterium]|nr:MAG: hypothetical protein JSU86_09540 [Phycisphaerales bacterium]
MNRNLMTGVVMAAMLVVANAEGAELSVGNVAVIPGDTQSVVVSGAIAGESTFGLTITLEIVPRSGNVGTVTFTAAPPVDILQLGDPWPGQGMFSTFDTDLAGSLLLNGSVDDNGTYVPGPVVFSGPLTAFPIVASEDATGVWDVTLSTSGYDSSWGGLITTLVPGTITVPPECSGDEECDDGDPCTEDACVENECVHVPWPGCGMIAHLDIKPGSCPNPVNRRSKGVVSIAVVGSNLFDVTQIDVDSLTLARADGVGGSITPMIGKRGPRVHIEDVATPFDSRRCTCHELSSDGIDDLVVKFSTPEMVSAVQLDGVPRRISVALTLTGSLMDGTVFEASDCVVVTGRPGRTLSGSRIGRGHHKP